MDQFQASSNPLQRGNGVPVVDDWAFSESDETLKAILPRFSGNIKATISHLATVHNETCGCQMPNPSQEVANRVWNQKKVPFMELQKQSGLDFEDYLNRVLRLLLTNPNISQVPPLSESEFWMTLRNSYPADNAKIECNADSMEEDLADINNLIAKDIGGELNQVFMPTSMTNSVASSSTSSATFSNSPMSSPLSSSLSNVDDLLRMKRKEKHMAPIDCTGVSSAFSLTWKCKPCDRQHHSKSDCEHYKNYHQPLEVIANDASRPNELPIELEQRHDGIYASDKGLKPYTRLGPLKGQVGNILLSSEILENYLEKTCETEIE